MNRLTTMTKSADISPITPEELAEINQYTIKSLSPEEVFVFNIVLCDNDLDRDFERFSVETLHQLAKLFIGKTGIFDHNPKGVNQNARIFHTQVVCDPARKVQDGSDYYCLKAKAYMVRTDSNKDLIMEIAGGIKKEVSIGFSAASRVCSICGADCLHDPCSHKKGQSYSFGGGQQLCYHSLCDPTDAYEWSFVAVPAQVSAGVVKQYHSKEEVQLSGDTYQKLFSQEESLSLSPSEAAELRDYMASLESLSAAGENYLKALKSEVMSYALSTQKGFDPEVFESVCNKMTPKELLNFRDTFKTAAYEQYPLFVQLADHPQEEKAIPQNDLSFCI